MRGLSRTFVALMLGWSMVAGAAPAIAQEPAAYEGPIQRGSTGDAVRDWQTAIGVSADGVFGPATQAATRSWQRNAGLSDHGGVGFASWSARFDTAPGVEVEFEGAGWGHGIGMSQYGAEAMARAGRSSSQILAHYYPGTTIRTVGEVLPPSDWLRSTPMPLWVGIESSSTITIEAKAGPLALCHDFADTLAIGSTGPLVQILEQRLVELGLLVGPVGEVFDVETDAAVRAFQQSQSLAIDGRVGPATRSRLWPMNDIENACALRVPIPAGSTVEVSSAGGGRCTVDGGPEVSCTGSVWADAGGALQPLAPAQRASVWGKRYLVGLAEFAHGILRLRHGSGSTLNAVLQVGIEDYVAGIAEVPASWDADTLRAQAIAARSYALASARNVGSDPSRRSCDCHLYGDARSQVYAGWTRETEYSGTWAAAAAATAGQVLSYGSTPIVSAYYSSSNGGRTENAGEAWGSSRPYLISKDDPWSLEPINPNDFWVSTRSAASVASAVGLDSVTEVAVAERFSSGAARTVEVWGTDDGVATSTTIPGKTLASRLGLKSHYFNVSWQGAPAPAAAPPPVLPFDDVAGSTHTAAIVALHDAGITKGCTEGSFCPNDSVTRAQIASFLVRAAGWPPATGDHFSDDGGSVHEPNINTMFEQGITNGCEAGLFCPNDRLKRYEMAVFLVRSLDGLEPGGPDAFTDDDGRWYEDYVNSLAAAGITLGCSQGRFCPNDTVTRAQMASFLYRAFLED